MLVKCDTSTLDTMVVCRSALYLFFNTIFNSLVRTRYPSLLFYGRTTWCMVDDNYLCKCIVINSFVTYSNTTLCIVLKFELRGVYFKWIEVTNIQHNWTLLNRCVTYESGLIFNDINMQFGSEIWNHVHISEMPNTSIYWLKIRREYYSKEWIRIENTGNMLLENFKFSHYKSQ